MEGKTLHGMNQQQTEVAAIKTFYKWLDKDGLKHITEARIMAAQKQVLSTRTAEAGVNHTPDAGCAKTPLR